MKRLTYPPQSYIIELFEYDPERGILIWRHNQNNQVKKGMVAGTINTAGHRQIKINGTFYLAHILIWIFQQNQNKEAAIEARNVAKSKYFGDYAV